MAQQKNLSQNNDLLERFTASFAGLRSHSNLPNGTTPFIWAIAVLLIVIFAAFYLNVRSNNEAILRTNLMKSTAKVADNIEMRLRASSASMARLIERLELDGNTAAVLNKFSRELLNSNPEITLIRLIEPSGKGIESMVNPRLGKRELRQYNYLDYPQVVRDAIADAFLSNRVSISSFWFTPGDSTSPSVVIVYPFTLEDKSYALLSRISLNKLLEESTPSSLRADYEFSLLHGTEEIAGRAAYNPPDDYTIPSYVRAADPLPPSIQLYGCNIVESLLIFASPLIYWLGALMLFLLISLFFLNKEMRKNQADLDRANRELELRRSIEDSISSAIVITDLENKIVYTNPAAQVITGYSEDELQGKTPPYPFWADTSVLPATLLGDPSKLDPAAFPYRFDLLVRRKDDEQLNVLLLATPFYSSYNEHIGWIYMMRDNTIESQSMNLTNDAIASYQRLLNSVMSCISVVSHKPTGTMLGIHNYHYTEQLGNTADGHLAISRACKIPFNPQGSREAEVWVDSLERWFSITEARVTLPGGSHVTLQSAQDITQRKINEKELEDQTNRMENSSRLITLGEMASTITHEINQPLTAITAYANTAIEVIGNAPEVNRGQVLEIYKKIAKQAGRIDKIIKNIRAFAKRRPTTLENVPLANVINDTQELGKLIEKKYAGIRIIYELPKVLPNVLCDPVQIMQILMNLIRNAAEAILEAGCTDRTIAVIAKVGANEVELQVADHGPGISDTMKASLFTPFFSTKKNGLGLGLSTCQTIAESHNTRLRVRDNEGGGTVFVFDLKICS